MKITSVHVAFISVWIGLILIIYPPFYSAAICGTSYNPNGIAPVNEVNFGCYPTWSAYLLFAGLGVFVIGGVIAFILHRKEKVVCTCQIRLEGEMLNNPKCECPIHECNYLDEAQAKCCGHNCGLD